MLLTTCPTCGAQFKVQTAQLNVRQGRVMCGRCRNVFNAFESLQRHQQAEGSADSNDAHVGETKTSAETTRPQAPDLSASRGFIPVDIAAVDLEVISGINAIQATATDVPVAQSIEVGHPVHASAASATPNSAPESRGAAPAREADTSSGVAIEAPRRGNYAVDVENPLLNAQTSRKKRGVSRIWPWLATLAFLVLSAQLLYLFRIDASPAIAASGSPQSCLRR